MNWNEYCISKLDLAKSNFKQTFHREFDWNNPKTLTEKIWWLKIYDSTMLKSFCADKIHLHDYSEQILGKDICIPIIKIYDKPDDINFDELPNNFVIKCNHGCHYNIIVKDKSKINKNNIVKQLNNWLAEDFAFKNGCELHYHLIERKIFIEQFMENKENNSLADYKFWCFNGEPKFFTINYDFGSGNINHYDLNGNFLPISRIDFPANKKRIDKIPNLLSKMIEYAKKLSNDFKFVRVDFYEINNKVYLGELTFTPASGKMKYDNPNTDLELGNLLKLN